MKVSHLNKLGLFVATCLVSITSQYALADDVCSSEKSIIAEQKAQIDSLNSQVVSLTGAITAMAKAQGAPSTITIEHPVTCQAVCFFELVGKGWTPGAIKYFNPGPATGQDLTSASKALLGKCEEERLSLQQRYGSTYSDYTTLGIATIAEQNQNQGDEALRHALSDQTDFTLFCK